MYSLTDTKNSIIERPNFISNWDNVLTSKECKDIIDYFNKLKHLGLTKDRSYQALNNYAKEDEAISLIHPEAFNFPSTHPIISSIVEKVIHYYNIYAKEYCSLQISSKNIYYSKIQYTKPGQGYHIWHAESEQLLTANRVAVFTLYLNTVELGGETEFLHQGVRVEAVEGRLSIFPAAFTHVHRGNPPLSGDKYIVTGWIEFAE
jgi:hypothetical protein